MGKIIDTAVSWAASIARDNSHGYSQSIRWGPSYDCSSLVISAYERAGIPLKSKYGATYTGNMAQALRKAGFENVTSKINLNTGKGLKKGDILLVHNNAHQHTELMYSDTQRVGAHWNYDGKAGDSSGKEISIKAYAKYPWTSVWRYPEKSTATTLKDVETVAREVIKGYWDNGYERQRKLEAAGYNYSEVQAKVNEMLKKL